MREATTAVAKRLSHMTMAERLAGLVEVRND